MSDKYEVFDAESRHSEENLDFPQILLRQIMRISFMGSKEMHEGKSVHDIQTGMSDYLPSTAHDYIEAVRSLENLLFPYLDKEYYELKKKVKEHYSETDDKKKREIAENPEDPYLRRSRLKNWVFYSRELFESLVSLMARKNLLLENDKSKVRS